MPPAEPTPVVVFDLDGTILQVNSFPHWVLFLIAGRLPELGLRRRAALSLRSAALLARRKLFHMRHDELMWRLQAAWRSACVDVRPDRFEASLLRRVRANLALVLRLVAEDRIDAILATAAAADYAENLGRRLGFRHVVATRSDRVAGEPGNSGAQKRERVLALLGTLGWRERPIILLTDHQDDLPLMRDSALVLWFGPATTLPAAEAAARQARFVYCRDLAMVQLPFA